MPKTNEIAFNVRLLDVLQTKHPRWRDHVGVEQRDVLGETALQPDIVIRPPGGVPVIIEIEFMPARSKELENGTGISGACRKDRASKTSLRISDCM